MTPIAQTSIAGDVSVPCLKDSGGMYAIEPASTWPGMGLGEARKRGQAFTLLPRESRSTVVTMVPFTETKFSVCNVTVGGQIDFAS